MNKSLAQPSNCNHFLSVGRFISLLFTGPSSLSLTSHYSTLKSVSLNSFLSLLLLSQRCRLQTVSLNTLLLLNCTNWWFVIQWLHQSTQGTTHCWVLTQQSGHLKLEINYCILGLRVKLDTHSATAAFTLNQTAAQCSACTGRQDVTEGGLSKRANYFTDWGRGI